MIANGRRVERYKKDSDIALKLFILYVTPLCVYLQSLFFATTNIWATLYIVIVCVYFFKNKGVKFQISSYDVLFFLFVIIIICATLGAGDYLSFLQYSLVLIFVFGYTKYSISCLYKYLDIILVFGLCCAIGCIIQEFWSGFHTLVVSKLFKSENFEVIKQLERNMGNSGIMPQTAYAAEFILNAGFILFFKEKTKTKKFTYGLILFIGLLLTGKRAHLFMGALVFFISFFIGYRGKKKTNKILYGVFSAFIVTTCLIFIKPLLPEDNTIVKGINTIINFDVNDEDIMHGREILYAEAIYMGNKAPLTGHGWGSFKKIVDYHGGSTDVHNIYLQLYAELGIIVLGIFTLCAILLVKKNIHVLKKARGIYGENSQEVKILKLAFCFICFFLLYGLTGNPLYNISFFIVLGLGVSMIKKVDSNISNM